MIDQTIGADGAKGLLVESIVGNSTHKVPAKSRLMGTWTRFIVERFRAGCESKGRSPIVRAISVLQISGFGGKVGAQMSVTTISPFSLTPHVATDRCKLLYLGKGPFPPPLPVACGSFQR
jgi:hypothetical protein